jgi:hypothetical protein
MLVAVTVAVLVKLQSECCKRRVEIRRLTVARPALLASPH